MPHYQLTILSRTGDYPFNCEAESPEAATAKFEALLDPLEKQHYRVESVTEREPLFGKTVIIGSGKIYGAWGYGDDLAEAKSAFRKNGGILSHGYLVLEFDEGTDFFGIDNMGRYSWSSEGQPPKQTVVEPK